MLKAGVVKSGSTTSTAAERGVGAPAKRFRGVGAPGVNDVRGVGAPAKRFRGVGAPGVNDVRGAGAAAQRFRRAEAPGVNVVQFTTGGMLRTPHVYPVDAMCG